MPDYQSEPEFEIIQGYFKKNNSSIGSIIKGIGDDAAVVDVSEQSNLVVSMDTLISGVHFPENTSPYDIATKSLAVNLSDLAAMGATPSWFTLALTLPDSNSKWLDDFSRGLFDVAMQYDIELVGGDTTQGLMSITIQVAGYVNDDQILYRHSAQINDDIYVSGYLGDAGAGLQIVTESSRDSAASDYLCGRLNRPTPRVALGEQIRLFANSCIDVSDGLLADLNHITKSSDCGASIDVANLPISNELTDNFNLERCYQFALNSGDDYELCFTAAKENSNEIQAVSDKLNIPITRIGEIVTQPGVNCFLEGKSYDIKNNGYQHFK